jgi:exosortase
MPRRLLILLTAIALLACYAPTIRTMTSLWWEDEDLGHCFAVPFVALWIVWRERDHWRKTPAEPSSWGFVILAIGAVMQALALMGVGVFTASVALLVSIVGAVVALGGFPYLRAWAFPLALLIFMLPKLVIVYNQVTLPLELLATRLAAGMLTVTGATIVREGNLLDVAGHRVAVAEACNGMRYLMSLAFVGVIFAYLTDSRPWMRVAVLAAAIPVAILGNALRVAAAGYSPRLDSGNAHEVSGWIIFLVCVGVLVTFRSILHTAVGRWHHA